WPPQNALAVAVIQGRLPAAAELPAEESLIRHRQPTQAVAPVRPLGVDAVSQKPSVSIAHPSLKHRLRDRVQGPPGQVTDDTILGPMGQLPFDDPNLVEGVEEVDRTVRRRVVHVPAFVWPARSASGVGPPRGIRFATALSRSRPTRGASRPRRG